MLGRPDLLAALVTVLAIIVYMVTAFRVGRMREKHGVAAPAVTGHPAFERAYRVQMNTLESMPIFLPALWLATLYFVLVPFLAPALGLVWIVGRIVYMQAYIADPAKRGLGFGIAGVSQLALLLLAIAGIVMSWSATSTV
ncbi:MAG TPA: MAPEG family protein [Rhizomicrobium sp.]|jgi:glutathione S-transferase